MRRSTADPPTPDPDGPVRIDGRYELGSLVGRGGMGAVYRALDTRLDRVVAVKVLRGAQDSGARRFDAEMRALARLVHPNLVRLLDAGYADGSAYLVMDLVDGPPLTRLLADGPLPERDVARLGTHVTAALAYAHGSGIVHRDVKPANILVAADGTAVLADFGVARLLDTTSLTASGTTVGTPAYLAPEQVVGDPVGPATDVYALGLVLLESLTGLRAFTGTPAEVAAARLHHAPPIPSAVAPSWRELLRAMTAHDPGARIDLEAVRAGLDARLSRARSTPAVRPAGMASHANVDDTKVLEPTELAWPPPDARVASRDVRPLHSARRIAVAVAVAGAAALAGGFALASVFTSGPPATAPSDTTVSGPSTTVPATTTTMPATTTTAPTTTTTVATPPGATSAAATAFLSALQNGAKIGSVSSAARQQLTAEERTVLAAAAQPGRGQVVGSFDALVASFNADVANGEIAGPSVPALTQSLGALATSIGVGVVSGPASGNGSNGIGRGQGDGNGG